MSFQFPHQPEVALNNPPLVEVVCQVRFPIILRIMQETPVAFQDQVRAAFPNLVLERNLRFRMPQIGRNDEPAADAEPVVYRFSSADEQTVLSLAPDFFAVTANRYSHWQDFKALVESTHTHVQTIYRPAHATRIGLRYINQLTLENTGSASGTEMIALLNPDLTSVFQNQASGALTGLVYQMSFTDTPTQLNLRVVYTQEQGEPVVFLDLDIFENGRLALDNLAAKLEYFHTILYDAFRWCLRNESLIRFQTPIGSEP